MEKNSLLSLLGHLSTSVHIWRSCWDSSRAEVDQSKPERQVWQSEMDFFSCRVWKLSQHYLWSESEGLSSWRRKKVLPLLLSCFPRSEFVSWMSRFGTQSPWFCCVHTGALQPEFRPVNPVRVSIPSGLLPLSDQVTSHRHVLTLHTWNRESRMEE